MRRVSRSSDPDAVASAFLGVLWHRLFGGFRGAGPSLAGYVVGTGTGRGATAAGGCSCWLSSLHMPVPKDRTDVAYVKPLADLRGYGDTLLYLGPHPPWRPGRRSRTHRRGTQHRHVVRRVIRVWVGPYRSAARPRLAREPSTRPHTLEAS